MRSPSFLFVGNGEPNCTQKQRRKQKKSKKAPPLSVSLPHPTTFRNIEKKENKKRGVEAPPLSPLLAMVGSKTFPLNYTHKHQKKKKEKKGELKLSLLLAMVGPRTPISIEKTKQSKRRGSQSSPTIGIRKPSCV
jgi:hypothetical protein